MPPRPFVKPCRQKITSRSRTSGSICLLCRISTSHGCRQWVNGLSGTRTAATISGSRSLHAGTPAKRPPAEAEAARQPVWTAAQPAIDASGINAFIKAKRAERESANMQTAVPLFRPAREGMGKWSKTGPLRPPAANLERTRRQENSVAQKASGPAVARQTSLDSITMNGEPRGTVGESTTQNRANPFTDILNSKKSASDIESDLFAGISSIPMNATTQPTEPSSSLGNLFRSTERDKISKSATRADSRKPKTSYTKSSQPFRISDSSVQDIVKTLGKAQEASRTNSQSEGDFYEFGFMTTDSRSTPAIPVQKPKLEAFVPIQEEGKRLVYSASWNSASRDKWSYEVNTLSEAEKEAERILKEEAKKLKMTEKESQERQMQMGEIENLKQAALKARFKLSAADLALWKPEPEKSEAPLDIKVQKPLYIPPSISVANFANLMKEPLPTLQRKMELLGLESEQRAYDYVLDSEMASLIALEFEFEPQVDESAGFDLYPQPIPEDLSKVPLRPPIVTIMGHVDHGKTTLLDTLRKSSVVASEAGGITQHIGAFSVRLSSGQQITFLDTPGHAAFLAMRERGANVTDIVVLVVAADDGVMPQTLEAINHARNAKVPIIVAINKCDREDADPVYVKTNLLENQVELEEFGGDIQCVEVSGLTGQGLDKLEEAIVTLAEVLEVRTPKDGHVEGWIIESTVDPGRGTYATVLVKRGTLKVGDYIVAGTTYAKVKRMTSDKGKSVKQALPGTAVEVAGWKECPDAGDIVLQAKKETEAKLVVRNRLAKQELERDLAEIESINERRAAANKERQQEKFRKLVEAENERSGRSLPGILKENDKGVKELRVIIKADVTGSAEAVKEAIKDLGNSEVKVAVIDASVGEITESDIAIAIATNSQILGFNIRALNPSLRTMTATYNIEISNHSVIYKLIDDVIERLESMLPPRYDTKVTGEAEIVQLFDIKINKAKKPIGGCKVINGVISIKEKCRITRNGKIIFDGYLDRLRHFKDNVKEVRKGSECGLSFAEFSDLKVGDLVQSYREIEQKRKLYG